MKNHNPVTYFYTEPGAGYQPVENLWNFTLALPPLYLPTKLLWIIAQ
ncbi:MAG TPA: hypothetical protein V6D03_04490 [Candidatus Caenarcaniphilales bacterium]